LHDRIVAKRLVIVAVFVTHGDAEDALGEKRVHIVLDSRRIARIADACSHCVDQARSPIRLAKQQRAGVGREMTAVEVGENFLPGKTGEDERF